jgi:hypothetical protein
MQSPARVLADAGFFVRAGLNEAQSSGGRAARVGVGLALKISAPIALDRFGF